MANGRTLGDLRDNAAKRCDQYGSGFIGRWEANDIINGALGALYEIVALRYKQHFLTSANVTLVAGTESYNLPTGLWHLIAAYRLDGTVRVRLPQMMVDDVAFLQDPLSALQELGELHYRVMGQKIYFAPKPTAAGTVEIWHVPEFTRLVDTHLDNGITVNPAYVAGADVINPAFLPSWEEYVYADYGAKASVKAEDDPQPFLALREAEKARILEASAHRDIGSPQRLTDVYGSFSGTRRRRR